MENVYLNKFTMDTTTMDGILGTYSIGLMPHMIEMILKTSALVHEKLRKRIYAKDCIAQIGQNDHSLRKRLLWVLKVVGAKFTPRFKSEWQ